MKTSTVFQQMYLWISKGFPASRSRHVARHSPTHCEHFECKQGGGGGIKYVANFPGSKNSLGAAGAQIVSCKEVLTSMGWGVQSGWGGGCQGSQVGPPPLCPEADLGGQTCKNIFMHWGSWMHRPLDLFTGQRSSMISCGCSGMIVGRKKPTDD